jgi:uncharacterized protein YndB with AHSA1/START domain
MAASQAVRQPETIGLELEIAMTRVLDAPRSLVFQAWTDPVRMAQWWGGEGFTNLNPGGAWRMVMRSPDGAEYPAAGVYREVTEPERLVFTNNMEDPAGNILLEGLTTLTFSEQDGKTQLTLESRAAVVDAFAIQFLEEMEAGWNQSLDRLGEYVSRAHRPTVGDNVRAMCRNIRPLFNFDPPVTEEEIRAASLQFVRKISGFQKPSKANERSFFAAVNEIAAVSARFLQSMETSAPPKNREEEAAKARARAAERMRA